MIPCAYGDEGRRGGRRGGRGGRRGKRRAHVIKTVLENAVYSHPMVFIIEKSNYDRTYFDNYYIIYNIIQCTIQFNIILYIIIV